MNKIKFIENIKKEISNNRLYYIVMFAMTIILTFMFINNIYNNPVADDYLNYNTSNSMTSDGRINTIGELINVTFNMSMQTYKTWQGTYFSNLLFPINPLLISFGAYKFTMFLVQVFWILSLFVFFISFSDRKKKNRKQYIFLSMLFTIFSVLCMYSLGEGVYWFTGVVLYLIPYSLSLLLFASIIRYLKTNKKIYLLIMLLLSIALGGTNYVTGLFVGFVYLCIVMYMFWKKDSRKYQFLILLILYAIAFSFNVFGPGNHNRVSDEIKVDMISIVHISLVNAKQMLEYLLFKTLYVPLLLIAFPFIRKIVLNSKIKFEKPIILILLCISCFICLFMPMSYAYRNFYQESRVTNIQLFYLVIMVTFSFINYYGYIIKKKDSVEKINDKTYLLIGVVSLTLMISAIGTSNIGGFVMIDDIMYKRSQQYDKCISDLDKYLRNSNMDETVIRGCSVYPNSLHHYVLQTDGWITDAMSNYYHTKIVVEDENES